MKDRLDRCFHLSQQNTNPRTELLAFGFITYPLLKIFSGKMKETSWLVYLLRAIFVARYIFL